MPDYVEVLARLAPARWATKLWICLNFADAFPGDRTLKIPYVEATFKKYGYVDHTWTTDAGEPRRYEGSINLTDMQAVREAVVTCALWLLGLGALARAMAYFLLWQITQNTSTRNLLQRAVTRLFCGAARGASPRV
eukprot:g4441.t1